ncbi:MAG: TonB-dependent receptor plug domain-containing protein, partial [Sphingopyxis sp.]
MTTKFSPDHRLKLLLGAAVAWHAVPAAATEAATDAATIIDGEASAEAAGDSYDGSEIIVSARRRDESAQNVPIALSVVGAETLEKTGNYTLTQVQQLVPSLQVFSFNPRNTNINIRGLGS